MHVFHRICCSLCTSTWHADREVAAVLQDLTRASQQPATQPRVTASAPAQPEREAGTPGLVVALQQSCAAERPQQPQHAGTAVAQPARAPEGNAATTEELLLRIDGHVLVVDATAVRTIVLPAGLSGAITSLRVRCPVPPTHSWSLCGQSLDRHKGCFDLILPKPSRAIGCSTGSGRAALEGRPGSAHHAGPGAHRFLVPAVLRTCAQFLVAHKFAAQSAYLWHVDTLTVLSRAAHDDLPKRVYCRVAVNQVTTRSAI